MPRKRGPGRPPKKRGPGRPPGSKNKKSRSAVLLGRRGGRKRTPRQTAARQQNATRAGRPKRVCIHCLAPALGGHVNRKLDDKCGKHGWTWRQHADQSPIPRAVVVDEIARLTALLASLPPDTIAAEIDPLTGLPPDGPPEEPEAAAPEAEEPPAPPEAPPAPVFDSVTGAPIVPDHRPGTVF